MWSRENNSREICSWEKDVAPFAINIGIEMGLSFIQSSWKGSKSLNQSELNLISVLPFSDLTVLTDLTCILLLKHSFQLKKIILDRFLLLESLTLCKLYLQYF